jgi:hypothetical protein
MTPQRLNSFNDFYFISKKKFRNDKKFFKQINVQLQSEDDQREV